MENKIMIVDYGYSDTTITTIHDKESKMGYVKINSLSSAQMADKILMMAWSLGINRIYIDSNGIGLALSHELANIKLKDKNIPFEIFAMKGTRIVDRNF